MNQGHQKYSVLMPKEEAAFLEKYGTIVEVNGEKWMHYPFWVKGADGIYSIVTYDNLPEEFKDGIKKIRGS